MYIAHKNYNQILGLREPRGMKMPTYTHNEEYGQKIPHLEKDALHMATLTIYEYQAYSVLYYYWHCDFWFFIFKVT